MQLSKIYKEFRLLTLIWVILMAYGMSEAKLPDLENNTTEVIPIEKQLLIGELIQQQLRQYQKIYNDLIVNEYVKHIGNKLAMYSDQKNGQFNFFVIENPEINAFATWGNNVAIFTGLIDATSSESELAAVMAHEMAHISQQHLNRHLQKMRMLTPITLAQIAAAVALGAPELIIPISDNMIQTSIKYTREHEYEADRVGIKTLEKAKFDPQAMPNFFEKLQQEVKYDQLVPEYLSTHPVHTSRISESRNNANTFPYRQRNDSLMYYLVKTRIDINKVQNKNKAINKYSNLIKTGKHASLTASHYGLALAKLQDEQLSESYEILQPIAKQHPMNLIIQLSMAELETKMGKYEQAILTLKKLDPIYPDSITIKSQYADTLIKQRQFAKAEAVLNELRKVYPHEPIVYNLLIQNYQLTKQNINYHLANAEWHYLHGNLSTAIGQIDIAIQNMPSNYRELERAKSRMAEIKDKLRQLKNNI